MSHSARVRPSTTIAKLPASGVSSQVREGGSTHSRVPRLERSRCKPFFLVALLVPLAYAGITGHVWEDYLITYRHSENLAKGVGLVFQPGERVHGFTSPLGVLLPALFQTIIRADSYVPALWCFRIVGALAFAGAGTLLLRQMERDPSVNRGSELVFMLLYLFEAKSVAFSVNGQESSLMMFFLTLGLLASYRGIEAQWRMAGLAWAGLMWTRPDGCIYIASLAITAWVFRRGTREGVLQGTWRAGLICAVIYLPWFLFAWSYYGNPIPHTIIAKGLGANGLNLWNPAGTLLQTLANYPNVMAKTFQPIYSNFGGWNAAILDTFGLVCGTLATIYWLLPTHDRLTRLASFLFTLNCLYMSFVGITYAPVPWYLPVIALPGTLVIARSLNELFAAKQTWSPLLIAGRIFQWLLVITAGGLLLATVIEIRAQQQEIENGTRTKIGLYLRENLAPGETVFLEPLGYIGYFSQAKMLDWPGLVAPEVVEIRRKSNTWPAVIATLKPNWLVLRVQEAQSLHQISNVLGDYKLVQDFDARERLAQYGPLPGQGYLDYDSHFLLFHRVVRP